MNRDESPYFYTQAPPMPRPAMHPPAPSVPLAQRLGVLPALAVVVMLGVTAVTAWQIVRDTPTQPQVREAPTVATLPTVAPPVAALPTVAPTPIVIERVRVVEVPVYAPAPAPRSATVPRSAPRPAPAPRSAPAQPRPAPAPVQQQAQPSAAPAYTPQTGDGVILAGAMVIDAVVGGLFGVAAEAADQNKYKSYDICGPKAVGAASRERC